MTISDAGSGINWKHNFFTFLRQELAPSSARWRAALRLTITCALIVAVMMSVRMPAGELLIVALFMVSQSDAWGSLSKAGIRVITTVLGGLIALIAIITCADKPWILFPLQAVVLAIGLFLSRTTTAPYAWSLFSVTFYIIVPEFISMPGASLERGLWVTFAFAVGALLGTISQFVLWPDDPEDLLLDDLAERLNRVEKILERVMTGPYVYATQKPARLPIPAVVTTGLAHQLDLLTDAEAKSHWLRQRHTEQIELITDVEVLVMNALRLDRLAAEPQGSTPFPAWIYQRLRAIHAECTRLRSALEGRRPPVGQAAVGGNSSAESEATDAETLALLPSIRAMEQTLTRMPEVMAFLSSPPDSRPSVLASPQPAREPVAERYFFTPACNLSNREAIQFALKGTLAASICGLLYQGVAWPGIHTSVYTCVTVSQSCFGAGRHKALLRFIGAALGGLASLAVMVSLTPNMTSLASLLVVTTPLFFVAAWVVVGSSRIAYAGYQMAIAVSLVLLNTFTPTIDLIPARDRLVGILLGIVVIGIIDVTLWPVSARSTIRHKLADVLHKMATLQRLIVQKNRAQARNTSFTIHRDLTSVLTLQDVLPFEPVSSAQEAEREGDALLQLINHAQRVFLKLLALGRHRVGMNLDGVAPPVVDRMNVLDEAVAKALEALGASLDGRQGVTMADIDNLLSDFERGVDSHPGGLVVAQLGEHIVLYREFLSSLTELGRDIQAVGKAGEQTELAPVPAPRLRRV